MRHAAWMIALSVLPAIPVGAEVKLLESDAQHVVIEMEPPSADIRTVSTSEREYVALSIPGFGFADQVGRPEVPVRSVRIALPPGTTPRLTVRSVEWSDWRAGAVRPVPERVGVREPFGPSRVEEQEPREGLEYRAQGTVPAEPFAVGGVASMRHLRTVSILAHGAQADPFRRRYRLLRHAVIEVRFEPDRGRDAAPVSRPAPPDASWSRAYQRTVVNGASVASFARAGLADGPSVGDTPFGSGDQWKIVVRETGLFDVPYETLAAEGFPPGEAVNRLALYQRGFDLDRVDDPGTAAADLFTTTPVPCEIVDANDNQMFDAGDAVRFWGRSFRDQWMPSGWEHEDRFTQDNVVWLTIEPEGGARMPTVREEGSLSGDPGDSLASTPHAYFREWDRKFYRRPTDFGPGRRAFESEFFFWNDSRDPTGGAVGWPLPGPDNGPETFEVVDLVPGSEASMTVRVMGGGGVDQRYTNRYEVTINDHDPPLGERQFYNRDMTDPDSVLSAFSIPPGVLTEGTNEFQFTGWTYKGFGTSQLFYSTRFFFDWYEVTWDRQLVARDERMTLTTANGTAGNQIVRVAGFGGSDLALYDVTDPENPARVGLAPDGSQVLDLGGTFDLLFDHDNAVDPGSYVAVRTSAVPEVPASQVARRAPTGVLAGGTGAEYVVVPHEEFAAGAAELADYRSTTYATHVASVHDVYDVFGNGQRSPRAIKSFGAYAFHRWTMPIEHLCLIGDGSEDTRGVTANSMPDFIPSHGLWASYEGAYDVSDQYLCEVTRGTPADADGFDDVADFHVGRLPVGNTEELDWNLQRIREYEAQGQNQLWRRRVMLHADDAISGDLGGGFGTPYGFRSIEVLFRNHSKAYAESLRSNHSNQVVPVPLYVSDWTSPCPDSCYFSNDYECEQDLGIDCGFWYDCRDGANWIEVYTCMKTSAAPALLAATREWVDRGVLLWNYQGHANRFWMAHEEVFRDDEIGSRHDILTLANERRPFIFLGWACHLGEYDTAEDVREDDERPAAGDHAARRCGRGLLELGLRVPESEHRLQSDLLRGDVPEGRRAPRAPVAGRGAHAEPDPVPGRVPPGRKHAAVGPAVSVVRGPGAGGERGDVPHSCDGGRGRGPGRRGRSRAGAGRARGNRRQDAAGLRGDEHQARGLRPR
jgi:hypothetical protein